MSFLDLFDIKEMKKLNIQPRKVYNTLSKGMVFYEVKTNYNKTRNRNDIEILREYVVIDNNQGKVSTICIHHCENYVVSKRTDWKKKISKQFRKFKTPKELEALYYIIPLIFQDFMGDFKIGDRNDFFSITTEMPLVKNENVYITLKGEE